MQEIFNKVGVKGEPLATYFLPSSHSTKLLNYVFVLHGPQREQLDVLSILDSQTTER